MVRKLVALGEQQVIQGVELGDALAKCVRVETQVQVLQRQMDRLEVKCEARGELLGKVTVQVDALEDERIGMVAAVSSQPACVEMGLLLERTALGTRAQLLQRYLQMSAVIAICH